MSIEKFTAYSITCDYCGDLFHGRNGLVWSDVENQMPQLFEEEVAADASEWRANEYGKHYCSQTCQDDDPTSDTKEK